uniref:Uncharacterized protein n=1 Tax=Arundo donax TaxID=35708 RepID=A0A0A8YGW7_ARUDO
MQTRSMLFTPVQQESHIPSGGI